jgi:hypothetical protein
MPLVLAFFAIWKFLTDRKYVSVESYWSWEPGKDLIHEIWVMNRGAGPVTLLEVEIGTASVGRFRKVVPECFVALLEAEGESSRPLVLGPREAKKFTFSALEVRRQFLAHEAAVSAPHGNKENCSEQILVIMHSRSRRPLVKKLLISEFSEVDVDNMIREIDTVRS